MKKIAFILAVALSIGGCAKEMQTLSDTISAAQSFKITQGQVDTARSSYNGFVLAPMRRYSKLVRCKTGQTLTLNNPCHDRTLLKQWRAVDIKVDKAFTDTQNRITSGDDQGAVAAYNSLISLIEIGKAIVAQTGISVLGN